MSPFESAFPLDKMSMADLSPNPNMGPMLPSIPAQPPQITTDQLSPFGHIGDTLNQYVANKQQQGLQNGFAQQILGMRFQPTVEDRMASYNQNTASLYAPQTFKGTTPEQQATNRIGLDLAPYTTMAKLQEGTVASGGGATGALVNRLMAENPGMTFSDALYSVQTGFRQGLQRNPDGTVVPIPGAPGAKGIFKQAEAQGSQVGESTGKAITDLPRVVDNANYAIKKIQELRDHPEVGALFGVRGAFGVLPQTGGADALARYKQITGQNFLQAYETLKGGGQITEMEGTKATDAMARLDRAQDVNAAKQAMNDLIDVIQIGVARAQGKAGVSPQMPATPMGNAAPKSSGWSIEREE